MNNSIYITINHLDDYNGLSNIKINSLLTLLKDLDNPYDDEAIAVYDQNKTKIGYVANSVYSVIRGTHSSGRIYDKIKNNDSFIVRFIGNDFIIAENK